MVVDTIWGVTLKKNELIAILENNPDLPPEVVESYRAKIDMYDAEIELLKSI